jgi:hypothetical protein
LLGSLPGFQVSASHSSLKQRDNEQNNKRGVFNKHNTTQHNTTQHNTTQHNATQRNATQRNATQHNTTQHNTTQHNTTQRNATQRNTLFWNLRQLDYTASHFILLSKGL